MLKNLAVLLTGAAGTLGSATAKALVSEGCKLILLDLPTSKGAELARKLGPNALFSPGSVTSDEDVIKALDLAKDKFGYLRAVVNCASVHRVFPLSSLKDKNLKGMEKMEEMLRVNVLGTLNVICHSLECMKENPVDKNDLRGVIVNTSGIGAFDGQKGQVGLASVWGAISSMTLPLCREVGPDGFRIMTIAPGLMQSNLTDNLPSKVVETFRSVTPFPHRFGYPEEYSHLVVAILKNNFLNGEVIRLDGGLRFVM